ncbi:hypothetical protein FRX31_016394, partial [Thalictrum thalictroides]
MMHWKSSSPQILKWEPPVLQDEFVVNTDGSMSDTKEGIREILETRMAEFYWHTAVELWRRLS